MHNNNILILSMIINFAHQPNDTFLWFIYAYAMEVVIEDNWFNTVSIQAQPVRDQRRCFWERVMGGWPEIT